MNDRKRTLLVYFKIIQLYALLTAGWIFFYLALLARRKISSNVMDIHSTQFQQILFTCIAFSILAATWQCLRLFVAYLRSTAFIEKDSLTVKRDFFLFKKTTSIQKSEVQSIYLAKAWPTLKSEPYTFIFIRYVRKNKKLFGLIFFELIKVRSLTDFLKKPFFERLPVIYDKKEKLFPSQDH